jgi:hypothetical protein
MRPLEEVLSSFIGRSIVEVGTDDDELMFGLDDGQIIWVYVEDEELVLTVSHEELKPQQ